MQLATLLLLIPLLQQDSGAGPAPGELPTEPDRAIHKLRLSSEFSALLHSAEPAITHPVDMAWDESRRPWVACTDGGNFGPGTVEGRIVVLSDQDLDGRFETAETFAEALRGLRSFVLHRGGVIAAIEGSLVRIQDEDLDGRGDSRTTLFEGFEDETVIDDLAYGLDGWIYGSHRPSGALSGDVRNSEERKIGALRGGVIRFRSDGSALELVSASEVAVGGVGLDGDGEIFFTTSFGGLRHVVLTEQLLQRGRIGGVQGWASLADGALGRVLEQGAGDPVAGGDAHVGVGSLVYGGGTWPADFENNYFTSDPVGGAAVRYTTRPRGVSFAARADTEPFLSSSDPWFRPWRLKTGPDGALYVLDYCQGSTGSPRGYGRIIRVDHKQAKPLPTVELWDAETRLLAAALEHPGIWHRRTAQRLLSERELTAADLEAILRTGLNSLESRGRIHVLWTLADTSPSHMQKVGVAMLRDFRPNVRLNALRATRDSDRKAVLRMGKMAEALLEDASPHVRLAALTALPGAFGVKMRSRILAIYRLANEDWTRSAIFGVGAGSPVDLIEDALAWGDERLEGLVRALVHRIGEEQDVRNAVGVLVAANRHHEESPKMVAASLAWLDEGLRPDVKPWSSPTMRSTLRSLLRSGSVEVGYAALPFAMRWIREGELRPELEELDLKLRDTVSSLDAASRVSRGFLETLTKSDNEEIARKARQRLRELDAEAGR